MNRQWIGLAMILGMVALALAVYAELPEPMPTHWNVFGQPDGWSSRFWGAFLMPLIAAGLLTFATLLRRIDRRRADHARFDAILGLVVRLMLMFIALLHVLTLTAALGVDVDVTRTILFMIGLLFIVLGRAMPNLTPNRWVGIRTRWTLASDRVWSCTHRVARNSFIVGGTIAVASAALPAPFGLILGIAAVLAAALVPVPYSWLVYRRLEDID